VVEGEEGVGFVGDGGGWRHGDAVCVQLARREFATALEKFHVAGKCVCTVMSLLLGPILPSIIV